MTEKLLFQVNYISHCFAKAVLDSAGGVGCIKLQVVWY